MLGEQNILLVNPSLADFPGRSADQLLHRDAVDGVEGTAYQSGCWLISIGLKERLRLSIYLPVLRNGGRHRAALQAQEDSGCKH
jgi:hypothetical protein